MSSRRGARFAAPSPYPLPLAGERNFGAQGRVKGPAPFRASPRNRLRYRRGPSRPLRLFVPVPAVGGEDGLAASGLRRSVERVGGGAPHRVVGHRAVRLEGGLVLVDLVEVVDVLFLLVLQHVEAQASRLVALRAERVDLDGF